MPNENRYAMAQGLARFGTASGVDPKMNARKARLGKDKTGGMFDIIYRKKREREKATQDAYNAY